MKHAALAPAVAPAAVAPAVAPVLPFVLPGIPQVIDSDLNNLAFVLLRQLTLGAGAGVRVGIEYIHMLLHSMPAVKPKVIILSHDGCTVQAMDAVRVAAAAIRVPVVYALSATNLGKALRSPAPIDAAAVYAVPPGPCRGMLVDMLHRASDAFGTYAALLGAAMSAAPPVLGMLAPPPTVAAPPLPVLPDLAALVVPPMPPPLMPALAPPALFL